jgi:lipopolysaccharide/colanic/teichoic acid biosynthesis glycosyltransferase
MGGGETSLIYIGESSAISAIAFIAGFSLLRRLSSFPGVMMNAYILPLFGMTYGLAFVLIFASETAASRSVMLGGLLLAVIWTYGAAWLNRRTHYFVFGVVPFGNVDRLTRSSMVQWEPLASLDAIPQRLDAVVADLKSDLPPEWSHFLAKCALNSIPVYHTKQIIESISGRVEIEHLSENNLGSLLPSATYQSLKRLIDIFGVFFTAPITLPLILIAAVTIKLEDGGPILFKQKRLGYRGEEFEILKLRTMRCESDGSAFTTEGDPRITAAGHFMRKYRIDELPQIFNILRGDMSWIGPRPESVELCQWHEEEIPFYSYRHIVRPGISGWAQVMQGAGTGIEEVYIKLQYDFYYVKNFSPWLDILIALKTIRVVLTGFGGR